MNILIFILVLGVLIFVHELGHFLFAKLFNIRVDEFGFGYPPKMFKLFRWRGTDFTMNWIPFGGFVKIFGESESDDELSEEEKKVSLVYKSRWQQLLVMFGGILFNILFAWSLFAGLYMYGVPTAVDAIPDTYKPQETQLLVSAVLPDSPAFESGLHTGDEIKEYFSFDHNSDVFTNDDYLPTEQIVSQISVIDEDVSDVADFIHTAGSSDYMVGFVVQRGDVLEHLVMRPEQNLVSDRYAVGINLDRVGVVKLPFFVALQHAAQNTAKYTVAILDGFGQLITGKISADNVSGPVGIVQQVGEASRIGLSYLVGFTALLSLNLAVLNIIPFPALDGGRMFIILIESIIQKRLNSRVIGWVNTIGFFALIALMIVVTVKDVINLF